MRTALPASFFPLVLRGLVVVLRGLVAFVRGLVVVVVGVIVVVVAAGESLSGAA